MEISEATPTPSRLTITPRRLERDEAVALHREIRETPNILGFTVGEWMRFRDLQVADIDGEFAGAALSLDMPFGWTDIAAICVLRAHRGAGTGKQLFYAAWKQAEIRKRHIYMMSRNPTVVEWMREKEMTIDARLWSAPVGVQIYMPIYMANWYRHVEIFRKSRMISKCPELVQGVKRCTENPSR